MSTVAFLGLLAGGCALLVWIGVDEARGGTRTTRLAALSVIVGLVAVAWLTLAQLHLHGGRLTCEIWPSTDVLGVDGSTSTIESTPAGAPRNATVACIHAARLHVGFSVAILLAAAAGYGVARRTRTGLPGRQREPAAEASSQ